ncbi:hypothetical protein KVR01_011367 [Diaporthe batatas]|uniref:uncharacterized protein n=1 Tax=Diaporthe batatas TaxID=748121 RepID=UPI001D03D2B6|nr:uncharacterized protein KVR01_011367 [Diaporthe batatas]KAG8158924.1 hypothetical protein KVR01_011367 [Diaporthe batatas]
MGLGTSVSSLLETYDNCISLLKAFKRRDKQDGSSRKGTKSSDQQALLKRSLKTDRKKVERAYSSRVSASGDRFEKGDTKALSSLGRVIQKLNAAIASLIRTASKGRGAGLDYQSLMSLSNSSRSQAIKAFDQLSRRLDSSRSSRSSAASTTSSSKSARTSKSSSSKASKTTTSSSSSSKPSDGGKHKRKSSKASKRHNHNTGHKEPRRQQQQHQEAERPGERLPPLRMDMSSSIATPLLDAMDHSPEHSARSSLRRRPSFANRFSLISMSSDSTRLGEIPERKWHRGGGGGGGGFGLDEYNTPVMYPVRPYQPQVRERRFLGLFRRGPAPGGH